MSKELKENMKMISHQIEHIKEEVEIIRKKKKSQVETLGLKIQ